MSRFIATRAIRGANRIVQEAEDLLAREEYDAVISDVRLSHPNGEEGLEIARLVKSRRPTTKVVLITAYGSSEMEDRMSALGADFYFEKPVSIEELRSALEGEAASAGFSLRSEERRKK